MVTIALLILALATLVLASLLLLKQREEILAIQKLGLETAAAPA